MNENVIVTHVDLWCQTLSSHPFRFPLFLSLVFILHLSASHTHTPASRQERRRRKGGERGVGLHSFHRCCASARQVTPSSVPRNWEGRMSSVCPYWTRPQPNHRAACEGIHMHVCFLSCACAHMHPCVSVCVCFKKDQADYIYSGKPNIATNLAPIRSPSIPH